MTAAALPGQRTSRSTARRRRLLADSLARAVRASLNLPRLRVESRRSSVLQCWQVRLHKGERSSDWITLDARSVAVMARLGVLPPKHLGTFRLAYDAIRTPHS